MKAKKTSFQGLNKSKQIKNVLVIVGGPAKKDSRPTPEMIKLAQKAYQLNKKNNYSKILIVGGAKKGKIPTAAVLRVMLLKYLPQDRILVEIKSRNVVQKAILSYGKLQKLKIKKITILFEAKSFLFGKYMFRQVYGHTGIRLKFEKSYAEYDPIEKGFYWLKNNILIKYYKIFGIK